MGPVLLALSTFRQSDAAIERAIELARNEKKKLVITEKRSQQRDDGEQSSCTGISE